MGRFDLVLLLIPIIIFSTYYRIHKYSKIEKNKIDKELFIIEKNNTKILSGFICFFVAILWLAAFIIVLIYTYHKFNYLGHINNIFQLLNIRYMNALIDHFANEGLSVELLEILQYVEIFVTNVFWIILLFSKAGLDFYLSRKYTTIYRDGILIKENFWDWKEFIGFRWSEPLEYKFFKKGKYYKLTLTAKSNHDINSEVKIKVKCEDKADVDNIIALYIDNPIEELQLIFKPFPIISTKRLILRKLRNEDKNEIFFLKSNEVVLKYLDNKRHETIDETEKYIDKINNGIGENEWIQWGITLKESDKIIGTICLWNISKENKTAEVGYELMPEYQGKGIMQEALIAVIKYAIRRIKLKTFIAYTHINNEKSIKLLERCGFVIESDVETHNIYQLNIKDVPFN